MVRRSRSAIVLLSGVFCLAALADSAVASPRPLPLIARLIERGDLPGFGPGAAIPFKTAKAWVDANTALTPVQASAQEARLRREGFKGLLSEYLGLGQSLRAGISWVMQLGSPAAARAELAAGLRGFKAQYVAAGGSFSAYSVGAIPGARGFRVAGNGQVGENVYFADGPFLYLVGEGWSTAVKKPPTRADLIAAVEKLYERVHGHPASS